MKKPIWTGLLIAVLLLAFLYAAGYGAALIGAVAQWRENPMETPTLPEPMPDVRQTPLT